MRNVLAVTALGLVGLTVTARAADSAAPDPAQVKAGRAIYSQNCASCHGINGEGAPNWRQPNELGEMPAPPHNQDGHTWKHADGMLYQIVQQGWRDPFNKTKRLTMPAFARNLSPAQTRDVIAYLKTLWTPEQRRFQQEESQHQPFPTEAQ